MDNVRRPRGAQACGKILTVRSGALLWLGMQSGTVNQLGFPPFLAERQMS